MSKHWELHKRCFPKGNLYHYQKKKEEAGREDMRGPNIELFTANNNFPSCSVHKKRII